MSLTPPVDALQAFLRQARTVGIAVAKNPDIWSAFARGGDWDLVTLNRRAATRILVDCVGPPDRRVRRSYVWSHYYEWGQIDLLPRLEWRGLLLLDAEPI